MYYKLTYILIIITFLATSCVSEGIGEISQPTGGEMAFEVASISRGSVTTDISNFVVFGDVKPLSSESDKTAVIFNKTNVEYKNGMWGYEGTQYWIPNNEHSFVALHPGRIFEQDNQPLYLNSRLSFNYSIPTTDGKLSSPEDISDLLVATYRKVYKDTESASTFDNQITFSFGHLFSLINLAPAFENNVLSSDDYIEIRKIEISGVKTKAQINVLPASIGYGNETYDMESEVNLQGDDDLVEIEFSTPVEIKNNSTNVSLFDADNALIMLPQTFPVDSKAEIIMSYSVSEGTDIKQVSLPLSNLKWESGKSYFYKFTIEETGIKFDEFEIVPWGVVPGEDIIVD